MPLHIGKGRTFSTAITDIIDYVKNPEKTDHGRLITSWQCDSRIADSQFFYSKQQYIRNTGRVRGTDDVIAYHLRQSFRPGEITPEEANRLGCELAKRFTKENNAFIVCTHIDKAHVHNHIIWSATTLDENKKFRNFWGSTKAVRRLNDTICFENGYSIVENPSKKGMRYDQWLGDKKKPSHRERICAAIDEAMAQNPGSFETLLELLTQAGYTVKAGKVPSLLGGEQKNFIRMDTLGENYTPEVLRSVITGQRTHSPKRRKSVMSQDQNIRLAIDFESAVHSGKGPGFEKWAKLFNMKQGSKAVTYLQEHGLTSYGDLEALNNELTQKSNTLRKEVRLLDDAIQENAITQKQITNYARTRKIYDGYIRAGYSKKYLEEHEKDILIHQAAKKYFDDKGMATIPKMQDLKRENIALVEKRKAVNSQYRKAKAEKEELSIVKANIDALLKADHQKTAFQER
jgi:hypothetical protein